MIIGIIFGVIMGIIGAFIFSNLYGKYTNKKLLRIHKITENLSKYDHYVDGKIVNLKLPEPEKEREEYVRKSITTVKIKPKKKVTKKKKTTRPAKKLVKLKYKK